MSKRKSFLKRQSRSSEMSLQITSMADIFIILLVFLLKSYSSGTFTIAPSAGMSLPQAKLTDHPSDGVKLEVSENAVLLEGKPVAPMQAFNFAASDVESNGISRSLLAALLVERNRERSNASGLEAASRAKGQQAGTVAGGKASSNEADPRIVVIADQRAPYQTIKTVLASAAMQGYTDVKLAVIHAE